MSVFPIFLKFFFWGSHCYKCRLFWIKRHIQKSLVSDKETLSVEMSPVSDKETQVKGRLFRINRLKPSFDPKCHASERTLLSVLFSKWSFVIAYARTSPFVVKVLTHCGVVSGAGFVREGGSESLSSKPLPTQTQEWVDNNPDFRTSTQDRRVQILNDLEYRWKLTPKGRELLKKKH